MAPCLQLIATMFLSLLQSIANKVPCFLFVFPKQPYKKDRQIVAFFMLNVHGKRVRKEIDCSWP